MNISRYRSWRSALFPVTAHPVIGGALGLGLAAVLIPILQHWHGAGGQLGPSIPLFFLIPVLVASAVGGRAAGVVVSVGALFTWDWFFIHPLYQVTIASARDVLALCVFFAVALLTGQLARTARQRALEALRRAHSTEAVYDLSVALIARHDLTDVLPMLMSRLRETFDLQACAVLLRPPEGGRWVTAASAGKMPGELSVEQSRDVAAVASWAMNEGQACGFGEQPEASAGPAPPRLKGLRPPTQFLPLTAGERTVGVLQLVQRRGATLDSDQQRLLTTFANGVALALEHERLAAEEREAAVARESDRLKSALLSSVSHDLRTPLGGIKAAASSLLQEDVQWSEADRKAFLTDIDSEADRLARIVSNLLDLSRIEAGAILPDTEWEDVAELVHRVVNRLAPTLSGHRIVREIAEAIPAVQIDALQIEQVLTNLIENAAKYSPSGTEITVSARGVDAEDAGRELRLAVSDQGPGIPSTEQAEIFDKFYRIAGSGRLAGGTGMGLAIVKGLVEAHGGRIELTSSSDKGSTFTVVLPMQSSQRLAERSSPSDTPVPAPGP